ncbi:MAG TPA: hypothetical protein VIK39_01420 [Candidatus Angelobacter sp.]
MTIIRRPATSPDGEPTYSVVRGLSSGLGEPFPAAPPQKWRGLGRALEQAGVGNQFKIAQLRKQIAVQGHEKITEILLDQLQLLALGFTDVEHEANCPDAMPAVRPGS